MVSFALMSVLTSLALQYGVLISNLARKFRHTKFDPAGFTNNPEIKTATSIIDYIFTWLNETFPRYSDDEDGPHLPEPHTAADAA